MLHESNCLIAPRSLTSNDCLTTVLTFAFDRSEFEKRGLRRLSKMACTYFQRNPINMFTRAPKKVSINHNTDHSLMSTFLLHKMSEIFNLKVAFNINLCSWRDEGSYCSSKEAIQVIQHFMSSYPLCGFSFNFQLIPDLSGREIEIAQNIRIGSRLQTLKIGCSDFPFHYLAALTQIQGLQKLVIHESVITYYNYPQQSSALVLNQSLAEFSLYKNVFCQIGQRALFELIIPMLYGLKKLKLPSNAIVDPSIDILRQHIQDKRLPMLECVNIGNNSIKIAALVSFMRTLKSSSILKLQLNFFSFDQGQFTQFAQTLSGNHVTQILDLRGCNLSLGDIVILNQYISPSLSEVRLSMNQFTEGQLNAQFPQGEMASPEEEAPISRAVKRPIESFYSGYFKCLKLY